MKAKAVNNNTWHDATQILRRKELKKYFQLSTMREFLMEFI